MHLIDLTGNKFGRWTVISISEQKTPAGQRRWLCRCDCGVEKYVQGYSLRQGVTKSCGCINLESIRERNHRHGSSVRGKVTTEYRIWGGMKTRCINPKNHTYPGYGGRGIRFCKRWETFANFLQDMGPKPKGASLDRIDVNGNYEPSNCRWATSRQQAMNRRLSLTVFIGTAAVKVADLPRYLGMNPVAGGYKCKSVVAT